MQRAYFSVRCTGRGIGRAFGRGQVRYGPRLIGDPDVRVLHRHLHVGMAGELLRLRECGSIAEQFRNVGMPPGGMEVGEIGGATDRPFDDPTVYAQATSMLRVAFGKD